MRRLLALACVLGIAGWLASVAAACHSEITARIDCSGNVSWTATAWTGSDANDQNRTNNDVRVYVWDSASSSYREIARGQFTKSNGFTFSGTYAAGTASSVKLKVQEAGRWGNGDAPAPAREVTVTKSGCSTGGGGGGGGTTTCPSNAMGKLVNVGNISVDSNKVAHITFSVAAGCQNVAVAFVSYSAPGPTFDERTADQQVLYQKVEATKSAGGPYELTVGVPNCYYQIDFVFPPVIERFGPAGSNNFYGKQGRLIRSMNGGQACTSGRTTTPPTQPAQPVAPPAAAPAAVPAPTITLVKLERAGNAGFARGPITVKVGDFVTYQMVVTNTGTSTVSVSLRDDGCDAGTLAPTGPQAILPGASVTYTCSHKIVAADGRQYVNTALATAENAGPTKATATASVTATIARGSVLGAQTKLKQVKAKKVKKVTKRAKPARPVILAADFTG
jgi:hypothetical protein